MEIMKKLQLLLVSVAMLSIFSCSDDDDDTLGVWYRRSDFDGRAREDAAGFVIGNRGYLCGGYRGKDQREKDCWDYKLFYFHKSCQPHGFFLFFLSALYLFGFSFLFIQSIFVPWHSLRDFSIDY